MILNFSQERKSLFSSFITPPFNGLDLKMGARELLKARQADPFVDRLCSILEIRNFTGDETSLADFCETKLSNLGCKVWKDETGNLYACKGSGPWPMFTAHLDSVFVCKETFLWMDETGWIGGSNSFGTQRGIGADDKCGVFVCLEMAAALDCVKIALFVSEEVGCIGSSKADRSFYDDVCYCIGVDGPETGIVSHKCSGTVMFDIDGEFWEKCSPALKRNFGSLALQHHTLTDVKNIREASVFPCVNISAGFYNWHSSGELTTVDAVRKVVGACKDAASSLGIKRYEEGKANLSGLPF